MGAYISVGQWVDTSRVTSSLMHIGKGWDDHYDIGGWLLDDSAKPWIERTCSDADALVFKKHKEKSSQQLVFYSGYKNELIALNKDPNKYYEDLVIDPDSEEDPFSPEYDKFLFCPLFSGKSLPIKTVHQERGYTELVGALAYTFQGQKGAAGLPSFSAKEMHTPDLIYETLLKELIGKHMPYYEYMRRSFNVKRFYTPEEWGQIFKLFPAGHSIHKLKLTPREDFFMYISF